MTVSEFNDQFDILYNNITSNQAPGLDKFEKSVFLTQAQEDILKAYFVPTSNKLGAGFDDHTLRQVNFSTILVTKKYTDFSDPIIDNHDESKLVDLSTEKILMVINEFVDVTRNDTDVRLVVVPITYSEYSRLLSKPYQRPLNSQAWRLNGADGDNEGRTVELIVSKGDTITSYTLRYVRKPQPIILTDLTAIDSSLSINGETSVSECELDVSLHQDILQRAVELAKSAYIGDLASQISVGVASKTDLGYISKGEQ